MCLPAILSDITGFSKKLKLVYEQNSASIQMKTSNVATTNEEQETAMNMFKNII